jgi:AraC family transcriptional activator of pobA
VSKKEFSEENKVAMKEDNYTFKGEQVQLINTSFTEWQHDACVLNYGIILICEQGSADVTANFKTWHLQPDAVSVFFPNDVVMLGKASDDFEVSALCFTPDVLREASLQLESVVYDSLRKDRCQTDSPIPGKLIKHMFATLSIYFEQEDCSCISQLVLLQLKGFFLGFYDFLSRHRSEQLESGDSQRANELFQRFNALIERDYKKSRDVSYYASLLHITPKHLNTVTHRVTHLSSKVIIDHYTVLQIKLLLRNSTQSVKEIAWDYNFSNSSFFCRYFRRHTNMTPQQYRKSLILK